MSFYQSIIRPVLFKFEPETAHEIGIKTLEKGFSTKSAQKILANRFSFKSKYEIKRFDLNFKNPLGIAAGFDKNGVVVNQLAALGFGFVEVGTVTFNPQKGNEKPRMFRLPEESALINRLGFNNEGTRQVIERLKKLSPNCVLGVNIGKNKNVPNEEAIENYLKSFDLAHEVADYIAINVSSPNTPNLRELQKAEYFEELLKELQNRNRVLSPAFRRKTPPKGGTQNLKPLLVKIAPDLGENEIEAIVDIVLKLNIAGIIATNTTTSRENLKTNIQETGGLSGKPLQTKSNEIISKIYKYSKGRIPIIGVGGIFTAEDAFGKIASGASLIQAYTGFIYKGFSFAREINSGLEHILNEKGFKNIDEAVGSYNK